MLFQATSKNHPSTISMQQIASQILYIAGQALKMRQLFRWGHGERTPFLQQSLLSSLLQVSFYLIY